MTASSKSADVQQPALLLSAAQMQAVDARAVAQGLDSFALMSAAGEAVCKAAIDLLVCRPGVFLIVAGPGNNGGDGAIAARALRDRGQTVRVLRFLPRSTLSASPGQGALTDADRAFALWDGESVDVCLDEPVLDSAVEEALASADVIVDALFGAGLSRPAEGVLVPLIDQINASSARVLAVDVPSGLNGNTHQAVGACIQATATVTFFRYKPAHFLFPGRALCGHTTLAQIGLEEAQLDPAWPNCLLNEPSGFVSSLPALSHEGHKFDRGHVLVRSGPVHASGAARLSAQTALCCGAGLVTLASSDAALQVNASHLTAVMLKPCNTVQQWQEILQDVRINSVVVGPGNGVDGATRDSVLQALAADKHCVLDADALSCWSSTEERQCLFTRLQTTAHTAVLTPHSGEFSRLFAEIDLKDDAGTQRSRWHLACEAAVRASAVVVLKGADTVIAAPDGRTAINANAPPWLATAGAGDVLAGLVASLLGQGMPAFEAACAAVWMHGQAAADLRYPITAEQLVTEVAEVLRGLSPVNH